MLDQPTRILAATRSERIKPVFRKYKDNGSPLVDFIETTSGRACLDILIDEKIDLAFIDVDLPEISGLEALCAARQFGIKTLVTMMSDLDDGHLRQAARDFEAYELLVAPIGRRAIEAIILAHSAVARGATVLVVDDIESVRKMIQKALAGSIFRVRCHEASDGEAALSQSRETIFDLVLLDYAMPGLSGLATLDRLLAADPDLRVIMMSSAQSEQCQAHAFHHGAFGFITKPFLSADIDSVLHTVFGLQSPALAIPTDPSLVCYSSSFVYDPRSASRFCWPRLPGSGPGGACRRLT